MFSVPRPPGYHGPPPNRPVRTWNAADPPALTGIKPILMKPPAPFKGDHDDIERFLGDCTMYFEIFQQYYQNIPSLMIVFATSHMEGNAQDWWVHLWDNYWYVSPEPEDDVTEEEIKDYDAGPHYQYPDWEMFVVF